MLIYIYIYIYICLSILIYIYNMYIFYTNTKIGATRTCRALRADFSLTVMRPEEFLKCARARHEYLFIYLPIYICILYIYIYLYIQCLFRPYIYIFFVTFFL